MMSNVLLAKQIFEVIHCFKKHNMPHIYTELYLNAELWEIENNILIKGEKITVETIFKEINQNNNNEYNINNIKSILSEHFISRMVTRSCSILLNAV